MAISCDGVRWSAFVQLLWSKGANGRTYDQPVDGLLATGSGVHFFVHRNVANVVAHADTNLLSVLTYAIEALSIRHILVVGHYDCGGVRAAMNNQRALGGASSTVIDNWLTSVRDVYRLHAGELDAIEDPEERHRRLVEKNVVEQCLNVFKTGVVQRRRSRPAGSVPSGAGGGGLLQVGRRIQARQANHLEC